MWDWMEWMDGVDTPQTVTTTRAPAVLKTEKWVNNEIFAVLPCTADYISSLCHIAGCTP